MEILWSERVYFGILGNTHIFVYYPLTFSWRINFWRVVTVDNKSWELVNIYGFSGIIIPSKYRGTYCKGLGTLVGLLLW